jgi:hypothetical protein
MFFLFVSLIERIVPNSFFSDKPNKLLIMDIYKGDGFDKLCPFLNLPIREEKFKL